MTSNGVSSVEEMNMSDCDGEKVVTMMDVLQEQQEFEDDANAVLGASDEKNCTYPKGYIKRQAIYACLTCVDAKEDPTKRAGVCLACSLICHENHELIELYTKRNFRCDCGNPKFNDHPCQFTDSKPDLNEDNKYNQNFIGVYCTCHRPYPDPEAPEEDEMIQCIICEDWLHSSHLEAVVPGNDQYSEMICKACMDKNNFLQDYTNIAVNVECGDVDVTSASANGDFKLDESINDVSKLSDYNESMETDDHKVDKCVKIDNDKSNCDNVIMNNSSPVGTQEPNEKEDKEAENTEPKIADFSEPKASNDAELKSDDSSDSKSENTESISGEHTKSEHNIEESTEESEKAADGETKACPNNEVTDMTAKAIEDTSNHSSVAENGDGTTSDEQISTTNGNEEKILTNETKDKVEELPEKNMNNTVDSENVANGSKDPVSENGIQDEEIKMDTAEQKTDNNEENCLDDSTIDNKRKLSEEQREDDNLCKKRKISSSNCIRPQGTKSILKGATFWPSNFRQKLCTCNTCIEMYKDLSVLFLIDQEDTVTAYETLGKERVDGSSASQYEKGLEALSSLDRVQQINAMTEYNNMRDKLLDFLKSFKDRKEVVKEEDIKAFFAGMKPKREPDGVYFCR